MREKTSQRDHTKGYCARVHSTHAVLGARDYIRRKRHSVLLCFVPLIVLLKQKHAYCLAGHEQAKRLHKWHGYGKSIDMGCLCKKVEELKKSGFRDMSKRQWQDGGPFVLKEKKSLRDQTDEILCHPLHISLSYFALCHFSLPPPGAGSQRK